MSEILDIAAIICGVISLLIVLGLAVARSV